MILILNCFSDDDWIKGPAFNPQLGLQIHALQKGINDTRLGICRDRRDRRSCKFFVSCVNFSIKQRSFLHILQVYTHL